MYTRPAYLWLLWLLQSLFKLYLFKSSSSNAGISGVGKKEKALIALAFVLSFTMFILGFALPCTRRTYTDIFDAGGFTYLAFGCIPIFGHTWHTTINVSLKRGLDTLMLFLINSGGMYLAWGLTSADRSCAPAGIALGTISLAGGLACAASLKWA